MAGTMGSMETDANFEQQQHDEKKKQTMMDMDNHVPHKDGDDPLTAAADRPCWMVEEFLRSPQQKDCLDCGRLPGAQVHARE